MTQHSIEHARGSGGDRPQRHTYGAVSRGRLQYAQVYEDPLLEIEALQPGPGRSLAIVSSGGCTALSLLAAGAERVVAVDNNTTQNDLVELKLAAVASLGSKSASEFLGAFPSSTADRWDVYRDVLRSQLSDVARRYWDAHPSAVRDGLLGAGAAERFSAAAAAGIRLAVHPRARIARMLSCRTLEEQRDLYRREWDTPRWRALFPLLFGRWTFRGSFWGPEVHAAARSGAFADHFRQRFERSLTAMPITTNYFLHFMFAGRYPDGALGGLPPYLSSDGCAALASRRARLELADGTFTAYLQAQPSASIHGFSISNIAEWLPASAIDPLFSEIARTAAPGARLCFRNLLGWTDVPPAWRGTFVPRAESATMFDRDRSTIQRRFVVCDVQPPG
ncbi:MAG: DUF3419 family protein [Polyangiaceae bacterium]|nr:DUF3419 family protein [Polyangiaceae bacterium]